MSSIYINNFPLLSYDLSLSGVDNKEELKVKVGFENSVPFSERINKHLLDIITSLLLHDKIYLNTKHLLYLLDIFGINDTLKLLRTDAFNLIDDNGLSFGITEGKTNNFLVAFGDVNKNKRNLNGIEWLEDRLINKRKLNKNLSNLILINSERINQTIENNIKDLIIKETLYDLNNNNLTDKYSISTRSMDKIASDDIFKILRIINLNKGLIYSSYVGSNNINIDGYAKSIIEFKVSPILQKNIIKNPSEIFSETIYKKGIPDLSGLYKNRILKIEDIINLRNNFHGVQFRKWCEEKKYDKVEIEKGFLNSGDSLYIRIPKFIRWIIPKTVGAIRPEIGLFLSAAESFVLSKVLDKWHPNLFLDNELKEIIDRKVMRYEIEQREKKVNNRFPKIGRNDKCPCGSRLKFKNCCGR